MATRGGIARITKDGSFCGVYHHWDSYPTGLGATLWDLYHNRHNKNLKSMMKELIDEHPAGWSTINDVDWSIKPGYTEDKDTPKCFCHGNRSEEKLTLTEENASEIGCEYIYAFKEEKDKDIMLILSSYVEGRKMIGFFGSGNPDAEWKIIAEINLNEHTMPSILKDGE